MAMALNSWVASKKRLVFDDLRAGKAPSEGEYDDGVWTEVKDLGAPQMGSTVYAPDKVALEFIYQNPGSAAVILSVEVEVPERVVFMPVPEWVVSTIWQGEVNGTYRFESEADQMVSAFASLLEEEENVKVFGTEFSDGGRN